MGEAINRLRELTRPTGEEDAMAVEYPAPRFNVTIKQAVIAAVLVVAACAGWYLLSARGPGPAPGQEYAALAPVAPSTTAAPTEMPTEIVVAVVGEVDRPGLITLAPGARVADAVAQAGARAAADLTAINLARVLADGEQILVPAIGAAPAAGLPGEPGEPGVSGGGGTGKVNINTADAAELETLDGVGPATAAAIIAHREEAGPFTAVEQLDDVAGIGPAKLAALVDSVTV